MSHASSNTTCDKYSLKDEEHLLTVMEVDTSARILSADINVRSQVRNRTLFAKFIVNGQVVNFQVDTVSM